MSEQILPELKDDRLSATIVKVAAEWAAEALPFVPGDDDMTIVEKRIAFMASTLQRFQGAMYRPEGGFVF